NAESALIQLEMAVVMGRGGNGALRVRHSDLEESARFFQQVVREIFAAQGVRPFIDCVVQISGDGPDDFDIFRHIDGRRIPDGGGNVAGQAEAFTDAAADGADAVKKL